MKRWLLIGALAACSSEPAKTSGQPDKGSDARPLAAKKPDAAAIAPPLVELAVVAVEHARSAGPALVVVIRADGSVEAGTNLDAPVVVTGLAVAPVEVTELLVRLHELGRAAATPSPATAVIDPPLLPCTAEELAGGLSGRGTADRGHLGGDGPGPAGDGRVGSGIVAAGLRGAALASACDARVPLVLADVAAPAQRLIEVLSTLPLARIGVTIDGGVHAEALALQLSYVGGNLPSKDPELAFPVRADGDVVDAALAKVRAGTTVRIGVVDGVTVGDLIGALTAVLQAGATTVGLGDPTSRKFGRVGKVSVPLPTITGAMDPAVVQRYLRRGPSALLECYTVALQMRPGRKGDVTASFVVGPTGAVTSSEAHGVDDLMAICVAEVIAAIEFPAPTDGGTANAQVVIGFEPGGG